MIEDDIRMAFVGDMSFGDYPFCQGYGVRSLISQKGGNFVFDRVREHLRDHDIVFGNLETVLSLAEERKSSLKSVQMRGDPAVLGALRNAGFNCINIANNHALQHGEAAFWDTVRGLEALGIGVVGKRTPGGPNSQAVFLETKGRKIGILGYAFEKDKYFSGVPMYAYGDLKVIGEDIGALRADVDLLIISCHWGLESIGRPSITTMEIARKMVDLGADVIIGHHPHVLQGLERHGNGLIAYSLGNFVFDMLWDDRLRESTILQVTVTPSGKLGWQDRPVWIDDSYRPILAESLDGKRDQTTITDLSRTIGGRLAEGYESHNLHYYSEYERLRKRNRTLAYRYFVANLMKYRKKFLKQQIFRTFQSRAEDLKEALG